MTEELIDNLKVEVPNEIESLSMLLEGKDPKLKMAVLNLIVSINDKAYIAIITPITESPNEKVRERAKAVIEYLLDEKG